MSLIELKTIILQNIVNNLWLFHSPPNSHQAKYQCAMHLAGNQVGQSFVGIWPILLECQHSVVEKQSTKLANSNKYLLKCTIIFPKIVSQIGEFNIKNKIKHFIFVQLINDIHFPHIIPTSVITRLMTPMDVCRAESAGNVFCGSNVASIRSMPNTERA